MFRKVIVTVLAVTMMIFAAGLAYADDIDGLTDIGDIGGYNVYVNPGNLGDVLIYGYYNVRGYGNFFTIVNTSDTGVKARIRFREATDSDEVLDFNICLSRYDMWTGFIVDDGTQGRLLSNEVEAGYTGTDLTLTFPPIPSGGVPFKHLGNGGLLTVTADETREGYYEVIGMVATNPEPTICTGDTVTDGTANDVPNALMGAHFMAEDTTGLTFAYRAMALAGFETWGLATTWGFPGPTLDSGLDGFEGVDWAITKETVNSEYMLELLVEAITGESSYVITFPTKHNNVDAPTTKFTSADGCGEDRDGVAISMEIFDDKENSITTPDQFSPFVTTEIELCYEVNVIELVNDTVTSNILNSGVEISISTGTFELGWIRIDLYDGVGAHLTDNESRTDETRGLPAWVWWLQTVDGALSHGNEMAYTTDIVPND